MNSINQGAADKVLITGDIATGTTILTELQWLSQTINAPLYFVLGNHDYYGSSIETVRKQVSQWAHTQPHTHWLDESDTFVCLKREYSLEMGDGEMPVMEIFSRHQFD